MNPSQTLDAALASTNPAKVQGTRSALRRLFGKFRLKCIQAPSGIPGQPIGLDQTLRGALRRAEHAAVKGSYGIGVEAGLLYHRNTKPFLLHACCIKKRGGRAAYGFSPAFQVPRRIYNMLEKGESLENAVENITGIEDLGKGVGLIGWVSRGRLARSTLVEECVFMAVVSLQAEMELRHGA